MEGIEGKRAFIIRVCYVLVWAGIGYGLLAYVLPLAAPFVLAFAIAGLIRRPSLFLSRKTGVPHRACAILTVSVFYILIGALVGGLGMKAGAWIGTAVQKLPELYTAQLEPGLITVLDSLKARIVRMDSAFLESLDGVRTQLLSGAGELVSKASVWAMSLVSGMAMAVPSFLVKLLLTVISTFFIAWDYDRILTFCMDRLGKRAKDTLHEVKVYVTGTLFVCARAYLLIMAVTFAELAVGLTVIGVENAVLLALLIAVFDILPVLGTGGVMLPWACVSLLQGAYGLAIGLILLYLGITVVRNIIEPKIVGAQLGLHPLVTLICMYAGVQIAGVLGLFGGPILLSLLNHLQGKKYHTE